MFVLQLFCQILDLRINLAASCFGNVNVSIHTYWFDEKDMDKYRKLDNLSIKLDETIVVQTNSNQTSTILSKN